MSEVISGYLTYSLAVVAVIVIFGGGIFLILRSFVLWYYKIYTIVDELQMNNALLREILDELMKRNTQTQSSQQPQEDYSRYMPK